MDYKDMYWQLFALSGDPEAYIRYRQSSAAAQTQGRTRAGRGPKPPA